MRRAAALWFLVLPLIALTSSKVSAQQSVYMLVDSIKGIEPAPHTGEFKINDFTYVVENATSLGTASTGLTAGKPTFGPVKVTMRLNPASSVSFLRNAIAGVRLPSVEIRLYNSSTGRMTYKTVFEGVYLNHVETQGADDATQAVQFAYTRVKWFVPTDATAVVASQQIGCWDIATSTKC